MVMPKYLSNKTIGHPEHSCSLINSSVTWNISSPVGYFYNKTWHNLLCQKKVEPSFNRYLACLRNREIYMVGDSTVREWLLSIADILNLALSVKRTSDALKIYHQPIKAFSKNKRDNITVTWAAHEFPFFAYSRNATIHHFKPANYHLNDKMIFKIFDNITHNIVYLNEWDITVSSENKDMHPSYDLRKPMIHELLSYICKYFQLTDYPPIYYYKMGAGVFISKNSQTPP
ncbi:uncharacterized protein [Mytilus edulis]|uniref:uncharacterized protein n=1 Tax=Mytilus edulis TaxID=6550 RepID=UPI0039EE1016